MAAVRRLSASRNVRFQRFDCIHVKGACCTCTFFSHVGTHLCNNNRIAFSCSPTQQAAVYEDVSGIELKPVEPEVFQNLAYGHVKHPAAARAQLPAAPTNGTAQDEEEDHTYEYI